MMRICPQVDQMVPKSVFRTHTLCFWCTVSGVNAGNVKYGIVVPRTADLSVGLKAFLELQPSPPPE